MWHSQTLRLIGDAAKNQVAINPTNTIFDAKRPIGRKYGVVGLDPHSPIIPPLNKVWWGLILTH